MDKTKNAQGTQSDKNIDKINYSVFPLTKINFILMAICIALIIVGFVLMGGSANDTGVFNPDIFSARRIVVGPALSFIGFVALAFALIYKKRGTDKAE